MLTDAKTRLDAAADLDRNVVVSAGAGTGKTRLLVDRLVHLLIGRGLPIRRIVALTFTDKAASEMRIRLADRLERLLAAARNPEPAAGDTKPGTGNPEPSDEIQFDLLRASYHLSADEIARRALAARADLDQALIGTIHSFAAHVLRLFPVEAGVDPTFEVDTGTALDAVFAREWAGWLGEELGARAPRREAWLGVLARLDLETVEAVAKALANFLVPVPLPPDAEARRRLADAARAMADGLDEAVKGCAQPANNLAVQMREYATMLRRAGTRTAGADSGTSATPASAEGYGGVPPKPVKSITQGEGGESPPTRVGARSAGETPRDPLDKEVSRAKKGWPEGAFEAARARAEAARDLLLACRDTDDAFLAALAALLEPFVLRFRQRFLAGRRVSFDGLLALARRLVQGSLRAQERLKREFAAILVDEFQDTDPVQAELLLFLAQQPGRPVRDLKDVRLAPGKLFVVGDPKQSIYGFRRADIAAFEWVKDLILAQGGQPYTLESNFRSDAGIVRAVNAVFGRLLVPEPGIQPPPAALVPARDAKADRPPPLRRGSGGQAGPAGAQAPPVELRLVRPSGDADAEASREAEAEALAAWIESYVASGPGEVGPAYRDVALLLRALTPVHTYLEAFKRRGIPYVVEGEKHFFANPEVVDCINLLRAVEDPHDRIALVGLLRSPVGGVSDRAVQALAEAGRLDYRAEVPPGLDARAAVEDLYGRLRRLHARARRLAPDRLVEACFAEMPLLAAAAAAYHGEQRVANLHKILRLAAEWAAEPGLTLGGFIRRLATAMEEGAEEGESPLADETVDAVRVLSIHKSKGLEFPVVILGNLHGAPRAGRADEPVLADWDTGAVGLSAGGVTSTARVVADLRAERREAAEARRVLYVAMTRAKDRLILSGVADPGRRSLLALLEEAAGGRLGGENEGGDRAVDAGHGTSATPASAEGYGGVPPKPVKSITQGEGGESPPTRVGARSAGDIPPVRFGDVEVPVTLIDPAASAAPRKGPPLPPERETDWVGYRERWSARETRARDLAARRRFVSPSLLEAERPDLDLFARDPAAPDPGKESAPTTRNEEPGTRNRSSLFPAIVGTLCHRVLETWDFAAPAKALPGAVARADALLRGTEERDDWESVGREALAILRAFHGSDAYAWIRSCEILGREIPILMPHADGQVMRGVIDLLVRDGKKVTVVDYKSDLVAKNDRKKKKAEEYRLQGGIYQEAVAKAAGVKAGFRLVFLRNGEIVDVE